MLLRAVGDFKKRELEDEEDELHSMNFTVPELLFRWNARVAWEPKAIIGYNQPFY